MISAENISRSIHGRTLFEGLSIGIQAGEKVALVGHNGAGKSTLLKILAGIDEPDTGKVARRNGIKVGWLPQQPHWPAGTTIRSILFSDDNPVAALVTKYKMAMEYPERLTENETVELTSLMDENNAWDYEARVTEVLGALGIHHLDAVVDNLSGGQMKRVALASALLSEPDLLLMDEPTNHLDIEAIEWLENRLSAQNQAFLVITHDRYFLDSIAKEIWELDAGKVFRHKGQYAYYLEKKQERVALEKVTAERAAQLLKKEVEWMRRQPKARGTKAKYRIDNVEVLRQKAKGPKERADIELQLGSKKLGGKILEVDNLNFAYGPRVMLNDFSYTFRKGDKIGIVGKNGAGKSTFLDLLLGRKMPDSGTIDWGETVKTGYYTQQIDSLNDANRVIDEIKEIAEVITLADGSTISISQLLERFLFPVSVQYDYVGKLSGGERRRLQLLKVLVIQPNYLVLDEPTNDLDLDTLNVLEEFLESWTGCLMLVSHDRYFMDRLVDHLFVFESDGTVKDFPGNYTDYREYAEEQKVLKAQEANSIKQVPAAVTQTVKETGTSAKTKASFKEQQEFKLLDASIPALEEKQAILQQKIASGEVKPEDWKALTQELESLRAEIDEKTLRWLELSEKV